MNKESKPKKKGIPRIFILIIMVYFVSSLMPAFVALLQDFRLPEIEIEEDIGAGQDDEPDYPYVDLELLSAVGKNLSKTQEWQDGTLSNTIPELKDLVIQDGYQLYQFDVEVLNKGNDNCRYDGSVYVTSEERDVIQLTVVYQEGNDEKDTRILPPGRKTVVTLYGLVQDGTADIYAKTYTTKHFKPVSINVEME